MITLCLSTQTVPYNSTALLRENHTAVSQLLSCLTSFVLVFGQHGVSTNLRGLRPRNKIILKMARYMANSPGLCCNSGGGRGNCRGCALHSHGTCRRRVGRTAGEGMEAVGTDNTSDVMRARRACFCFPKALEASNIDRQGCRSRERRHGIERVTNSLFFVISYETGDIG